MTTRDQDPWLSLAGGLSLIIPLLGLPVVVWLFSVTANFWVFIAVPPLFGLGFLLLGRPRAYGLAVVTAALLPVAWWFGLLGWVDRACTGRPAGEFCGLGWLLIALAGLVVLLLLLLISTTVLTERAVRRARRSRRP